MSLPLSVRIFFLSPWPVCPTNRFFLRSLEQEGLSAHAHCPPQVGPCWSPWSEGVSAPPCHGESLAP